MANLFVNVYGYLDSNQTLIDALILDVVYWETFTNLIDQIRLKQEGWYLCPRVTVEMSYVIVSVNREPCVVADSIKGFPWKDFHPDRPLSISSDPLTIWNLKLLR